MNILFVCTGNTCRSPMAEAILRHISENKMIVKSAGVFASDGSEASTHAKMIMDQKGIKHQHASQQVTVDLIEWADYILTMTNQHKSLLMALYPDNGTKLYTLKEFVGCRDVDVQDPYGGSLEVYEKTYDELFLHIQVLKNKLLGESSQ